MKGRWKWALPALAAALCLLLGGCQAKVEEFMADERQDSLAQVVFAAIQSGDAGPILEEAHPQYVDNFANAQEMLTANAGYVAQGEAAWQTQARNVKKQGAETYDQSQYLVTVGGRETYLLGIVHLTNGEGEGLYNFQVVKQADLEAANQTHTPWRYVGYGLTALCWGAMIVCIFLLARSDMTYKPLWALFILFGTPGFTLSMQEGSMNIGINFLALGFNKLLFSATASVIQIAIPVGVVTFLILYGVKRRNQRRFASANRDESGS